MFVSIFIQQQVMLLSFIFQLRFAIVHKMVKAYTYKLINYLFMNSQLQKLLLAGGVIGAGYLLFNRASSQPLISLQQTRKILKQIKHQILIVSIGFAEGCKTNIEKIQQANPSKLEQVRKYFRTKLAQVYQQKQQLILGKYDIKKEQFSQALQKYAKDVKVKAFRSQIMDIMERAVQGHAPNLQVDHRATKAFTKTQMLQNYEQMSKMILTMITEKLQQKVRTDDSFNPDDDTHFRKVIKQLSIYDKKVQFFKNKGFNQQWGCPNEVFFKLSEGLKIKDEEFKQQMKRMQQIYENVVDIVAKNPMAVQVNKIDELYKIKQSSSKTAGQKKMNLGNGQKTKIPSSVVGKKEESIKKQEHQQYINLNKSTRSQPDEQQREQKSTQNKQPQIEKSEAVQKAQSVNLQVQKTIEQEQNKKQESIEFEDVPSDAHQLQKQMNNHSKQESQNADHIDVKPAQIEQAHNQQKDQKQPQAVQRALSNVSLDEEPIQTQSFNHQQNENANKDQY